MYSESQLRSHIYDLQRFLRRIEQSQGHSQPLAADGIFGPETASHVRDFQRRNGLRITGTADFGTWVAIYEQYLSLLKGDLMPSALLFFPTGADVKLSEGCKGAAVTALQFMLNSPVSHYMNLSPTPITGDYDTATVASVKLAQQACMLPVTGVTDRATWDALALLHNSLFERVPIDWILSEQKRPATQR